ncbi:MAG: translocation/assembly module TamB [Candidatus Dependentiae bacterium]|nr:translocation/assembly module TamB [Candidatus Dependentiae bacterium]
MIKKIFLSLGAGVAIAASLFLHEPWLASWLERKVLHSFGQALDCSVEGKLEKFHVFSPSIYIKDMAMKPHNGKSGWDWRCKRFILRTSWWRLVRENTVVLDISVESLSADSAVTDGAFAIEEHLQKMVEDTPLPVSIALNSVTVSDAAFIAHDDEKKLWVQCQWNSNIACPGKDLDLTMNIKRACIGQDSVCFIKECVGKITGKASSDKPFNAHIDFSYIVPSLDKQACSLSASYAQNKLLCSFSTKEKDITFEDMQLYKDGENWKFTIEGSAKLEKLAQVVMSTEQVQGTCAVQLSGCLGGTMPFQGSLSFDHIHHAVLPEDAKVRFDFSGTKQALTGTVAGAMQAAELQGNYAIDISNQTAQLELDNTTVVDVPAVGITLPANHCSLKAKLSNWKDLIGEVVVTLLDDQKKETSLVSMNFAAPHFQVTMPLNTIRPLVKQHAQLDMQSDGSLSIHGHYDTDLITTDITLRDGMIRLPQTYNFINRLNASCILDLKKNKIIGREVAIGLHRGSLVFKNIQCHFKEGSFVPHYIYVPCAFENLFLNFKKDLFTTLSGTILFEKRDQADPSCRGTIILDRSQLKENLFSLAFQKQLFSHATGSIPLFDLNFDIAIETKEPIRVRTALLDANVKASVQVAGSLSDPRFSGQMSIVAGTIALPYQPLFITKGLVSCMPTNMHDPYIEFVAKNRIKKYNITMSVGGSLQQPVIMLESSPPLTQEQIIALLLGGSEDSLVGALSGALSTVLAHNIKHIIFDTEHSPSKLHSAIDSLFSPFKHVRLVPSFSDQTGRAGLRGAIEIDIGERWHALIQKNFSLSEDTRFEASYAITDDVMIRGFRDEHRDLGAEVEFRWKF